MSTYNRSTPLFVTSPTKLKRKAGVKRLTMLGTGNALVTEYYNTCFVLEDEGKELLVDSGGGSAILAQLKHAGYDWMDIRHIFVTHKHVNHLLGIVWTIRMICKFMDHGEYQGDAYLYSHVEALELLRDMAGRLLQAKEAAHVYERLHFVEGARQGRAYAQGNSGSLRIWKP